MKQQFLFFVQDIKRMVGKKKSRIIYIWLSRSFAGVMMYRIERGLFLTFGTFYSALRILFLPLINILQAFSNLDIHYRANIKGGILVLHPSNGVVVSGCANVGYNLTLTGGNVIGISKKCSDGDFIIGDNCNLGANSVIIGPLKLGSNINVGASACVVKNFNESNIVLGGVPAKMLKKIS